MHSVELLKFNDHKHIFGGIIFWVNKIRLLMAKYFSVYLLNYLSTTVLSNSD